MKKIMSITLLFSLFLITISSASAAENATDLGDLITNAPDKSIVELGEGTYKNNVTNINIDKNLKIVGKGTDKTIIDANKAGRIFNIEYNGTLTLINLTLINGKMTGYDGGGAIYNEGTLKLINCELNNNTADYGGAIYSDIYGQAQVNIINSTFTNNEAIYGGAIYNTAPINITNCVFTKNKAERGGAIFTGYTVIVNITNSIFTDNSAIEGGAIIITNSTAIINNCDFANNIATNGSAIHNMYGYPNMTVINSNFTENKGGPTIYLEYGTNTTITGCNIFNNSHGILIMENEYDPDDYITINYNRIFNNTEYDLNCAGTNVNADYNWWGNNTPDMTNKIIGIIPNNYFVMYVTNLTSLDSNGTVTFQYTFRLNNSETADNSLLPYFVTNVYTNVTDGIVTSFDARYDRPFDVTVNSNGNVLYSFITDNEVQTLEGNVTIPEPVDPVDPVDPIDPVEPVEPVDPIDPMDPNEPNNNETTSNQTASAVMKETGIPILAILIVLLSSLGLIIRKK